MSQLPFRLSDDWKLARVQIEELLRILYEERIGGLRPSEYVIKDGDKINLDLNKLEDWIDSL